MNTPKNDYASKRKDIHVSGFDPDDDYPETQAGGYHTAEDDLLPEERNLNTRPRTYLEKKSDVDDATWDVNFYQDEVADYNKEIEAIRGRKSASTKNLASSKRALSKAEKNLQDYLASVKAKKESGLYEAANPDVNIIVKDFGGHNLVTDYITAYASTPEKLPMVIWMEDTYFAEPAEGGYFVDLRKYYEKSEETSYDLYYESMLHAAAYNGVFKPLSEDENPEYGLYFAPRDYNKPTLVYNKKLMADLGVEIPAEKIPLIQKRLIQRCRARKKPVIVATQMLHSMIENPRPTRAEVSDVANAIQQSTDAIMLSGETASGKYPVEAVKTMSRIALETEESILTPPDLDLVNVTKPIAAVLARSLVAATLKLPVKAIIFDTWTGRTGRYLAEFRPKVPIYAMCYRGFTMRELALTFDIYGYPFEVTGTKEGFVENSLKILVEDGKLESGDLVGFIGGSFNDEVGATYMEFKYVP